MGDENEAVPPVDVTKACRVRLQDGIQPFPSPMPPELQYVRDLMALDQEQAKLLHWAHPVPCIP